MTPSSARAGTSKCSTVVSCLLIGMVAFGAWHNSFRGPFILDDVPAIVENATIHRLWPPSTVLSPPRDGETVGGHPLVNLSFAVNWAVSGERVWSYHVLNLAIHLGAALALFAVVRRTLRASCVGDRLRGSATPVACTLAALWVLHPLQTATVTYVAQRAEALAGFCLLLTLYASIRGAAPTASRGWHLLGVSACLAGMAAKEVMVVAPVLVWLHDAIFLSAAWREPLARRRHFHLALAATWLLLGWLLWSSGNRGATAGLGLGISPWHYLLTQCRAVILYVQLTVWPAPLVFDYGSPVVGALAEVWP